MRAKKTWLIVCTVCCVGGGVQARAENALVDRILGVGVEEAPRTKPQLDPKRIINESNGFLKEREPEMTAEEYALYEKVLTMLGTNPEFALKLLEAMMSDKEPPSPAFQFILGNAYYAAGQNDKAEASYRAAVDRYPTFLRAWNNLGILYYTTERYPEAIKCFSKSVVLGDRDPTTFGLLGFSLERVGNVVSAEMAYMQALSGDPDNPDWKDGLLRIYVDGRQYGRAESLVKNLITERPKETRYWLTYASILIADGRKPEAIALLETCADVGVADTDELTLLGDLYAEYHLVDEAVAIYTKVLGPSRTVGEKRLLQFARVLIAAGKLDRAAQVLQPLEAQVTPENQQAVLQTRADLLMARKQWTEARKVAESILQEAPLDGDALLILGRTYAAEGDLSHASFAFEEAERISGTTYPASLELANIEIKNRHYAESAKYLQKALSLQRTDAVEDYLARVQALAAKVD